MPSLPNNEISSQDGLGKTLTLYRQGRLGEAALARDDGLLPVMLTPTPAITSNGDDGAAGTIVLEIGQVRIRIEGRADASVLAQVLERVLR